MGAERRADIADFVPASVSNRKGAGPFIVVCDHASNHVPAKFGTLGLRPDDLARHIAWDPGALGVAAELARLLDAPLAESHVSRLIIDCNRPLDAPDLISPLSETTEIPGNRELDAAAWEERVAISHRPFHAADENLVALALTPAEAELVGRDNRKLIRQWVRKEALVKRGELALDRLRDVDLSKLPFEGRSHQWDGRHLLEWTAGTVMATAIFNEPGELRLLGG